MNSHLRIGSRPSPLALAQARLVEASIKAQLPQLRVEIVTIRTSGDRLTTASLADIGGKGLFIREIEQALVAGEIDIAVHSMKDLPARLSEQFRIVAVPPREDPRDALIARDGGPLASLPRGACVGTSSNRRRFEALRIRPDLEVVPMRGNVDTRLAKMAAGGFDAIMLAMAGLKRLGRAEGLVSQVLDDRDFVPAGAQGALAIEALSQGAIAGSNELERTVVAINDRRAAAETAAERTFLARIGASCATAVGVRCVLERDHLQIRALLFDAHGKRSLDDEIDRIVDENPAAAGLDLGERMLARGAAELVGDGRE